MNLVRFSELLYPRDSSAIANSSALLIEETKSGTKIERIDFKFFFKLLFLKLAPRHLWASIILFISSNIVGINLKVIVIVSAISLGLNPIKLKGYSIDSIELEISFAEVVVITIEVDKIKEMSLKNTVVLFFILFRDIYMCPVVNNFDSASKIKFIKVVKNANPITNKLFFMNFETLIPDILINMIHDKKIKFKASIFLVENISKVVIKDISILVLGLSLCIIELPGIYLPMDIFLNKFIKVLLSSKALIVLFLHHQRLKYHCLHCIHGC